MTGSIQLTTGDEVTLKIDNIAHGGISVARHDGRVVFVSDAIPGETVRAQITESKKKSFARATAVEVLESSPDRVEHIWPEAAIGRNIIDRVGGAEFGHIKLERQRSLKEQVLQESMQRFGGLDASTKVLPLGDGEENNGLGYRSRVRLHVDAETGTVGPYAARSRRVVEVESLPLAGEQINLIAPLGEYMPDVSAVDVVAPSGDDPRSLLTFHGEKRRRGENDTVIEYVGDRPFRVAAGGFWQVHYSAATTLYEHVAAILKTVGDGFDPLATNMDLYGGVGLFARAIAEVGGKNTKLTTVEASSNATDNAAENLADYVGAMAVTSRVDRYLKEVSKNQTRQTASRMSAATVVLDPPRSGAGGDVTKTLLSLNPKNIVYIACDPVALARDTKTITEAGYSLQNFAAFDLFPHTHHFESVALFTRDKR